MVRCTLQLRSGPEFKTHVNLVGLFSHFDENCNNIALCTLQTNCLILISNSRSPMHFKRAK